MLKDYITREELQSSITQLEQAIYNHQQWYSNLIRTLICRLPPDDHDLVKDAHHHCRFGQWYYGNTIPEKITVHPGFIAIGKEHEHMHELCAQILRENTTDKISPLHFDKFANALETLRLEISALTKELEETLYNHDSLTGAINRVSMLPILREQQELVKRDRSKCCLGMMDIDFFKEANDTYGHIAGDKILAELIAYCLANIRPYDKIFRYGGEEFLFLLPHTDLEEACTIMSRIQNHIASMKFELGSQGSAQLTVSIGIANLSADTPIETSIEKSDKALYKAKQAGRNCIKIFTEDV